MKIVELNKKDFNRISSSFHDATFHQTSNWADVKALTGWKSLFLAYQDEKQNNIAVGLVLLKKTPIFNSYMAYIPRGFLMDYSNINVLDSLLKELKEYLKQRNVFEIMLDPYCEYRQRDINGNPIDEHTNQIVIDTFNKNSYKHLGFNLYNETLQPRWLFRLNIKDKSYEDLYKEFKTLAKRKIKKQELFAINVRELRDNEIQTFKNIMQETAKRKKFIDRPLAYYEQMFNCLHNDNILKYMVAEMDVDLCFDNIKHEIAIQQETIKKLSEHEEKNAEKIKDEQAKLQALSNHIPSLEKLKAKYGSIAPLSVTCLMNYGQESIMLLAGNDEEYMQEFGSSNIMISEIIKQAVNDHYSYFNFYGIPGNISEENGLYVYKRLYGGEVVELIGEFHCVLNPIIKKFYDVGLSLYNLTKKV